MNTVVALWIICASLAWLTVLYSHLRILALITPETRTAILWDLSFWRFDRAAEKLTDPARAHLRRGRLAGWIFVAIVAIPLVVMYVISLLGWLFAAAAAR